MSTGTVTCLVTRRVADTVRRVADTVRRAADTVRRVADTVRRAADTVRRAADTVRRHQVLFTASIHDHMHRNVAVQRDNGNQYR